MARRPKVFKYRVSAIIRSDFPGFRRDGYFFPNEPDFIALDEVSEAIRQEPMLSIQEVADDNTKLIDGT